MPSVYEDFKIHVYSKVGQRTSKVFRIHNGISRFIETKFHVKATAIVQRIEKTIGIKGFSFEEITSNVITKLKHRIIILEESNEEKVSRINEQKAKMEQMKADDKVSKEEMRKIIEENIKESIEQKAKIRNIQETVESLVKVENIKIEEEKEETKKKRKKRKSDRLKNFNESI